MKKPCTLSNRGVVTQTNLDFRAVLEKAIDIYKQNYDPNPRVARSLYFKSEILEAMEQLEKAFSKRREASELRNTITTFVWEKAEDFGAYNNLVCSFFR